jgi:rhodanese-related sulfurtransferase
MTKDVPWEIECRDVQAMLGNKEKMLLLDCREADEHAVASIAGARLVPMGQLAERLGELSAYRDAPIVVHCHHGGRSLKVAHWLRGQGYANAQSMAGGIDRWSMEIDPTIPRY